MDSSLAEVEGQRVGLTPEGEELAELLEERDWEIAVAQRWRERAAEWAAIDADCTLIRWLAAGAAATRWADAGETRWRAAGAAYGAAHAAADRAAAVELEIRQLVGEGGL